MLKEILETMSEKEKIITFNHNFALINEKLDKLAEVEERTKKYTDEKFTIMQESIHTVDSKVTSIETRLGIIETRLDNIETRLGSIETRLGSIEGTLNQILQKLS